MPKKLCYLLELPDSKVTFSVLLIADKVCLSVAGIDECYAIDQLIIVENPTAQLHGYYICDYATPVWSLEELSLQDIGALSVHFGLLIEHEYNDIYAMEAHSPVGAERYQSIKT
ncbi:hypothetical protein FR932_14230 [Moritella marina ATCC 15381]|uniref:Uncharacterized protein n=1 Tax=Moritella marina ATCC 15381 TaxID=1202962 RepID=A0A5J6WLE1_MORMI|nr:hypothetical protein [Moritella marina]QFI38929.1 hypothetical protein FR932_14230 [Moritella marina ATCC 15381]